MARYCALALIAASCFMTLQPAAISFPYDQRPVCPGSTTCIPISKCPAYSTRRSIQRHRPPPCDFQDLQPLVCCPQPTEPLFHCGNPNRTIYRLLGFASLPDPPATDSGRPVFQLGRPPDGRRRTNRSSRQRRAPPRREEGIGGFNAEPGRWPWLALMGDWNTDQQLKDWFCGGSLITTRHVLTAAHCVSHKQHNSFGVRIGDHTLSIDTEVQHQDRRVRSVIVHEMYHSSQNDIALITLTQPVRLTEAVRPVCLPPVDLKLTDGQRVSMAGWGYLQFRGDETPDVLQEVPLQLANVRQCERAYREVPDFHDDFPGGFQGTKLCAASVDEEIRGACGGDSGGPLMTHDGEGFSYIVGIVSNGVGCGNPLFPGVYTRVSSYLNWVFEKVQQ